MVPGEYCRFRCGRGLKNMKRWAAWIGLFVSLALLAVMLSRMNLQTFVDAFSDIKPLWLVVAALFAVASQAGRALRWNIVSGRPLYQFSHFWRAAAIGQFCNFIYPLRAGDVLRMMSLKKFAKVPLGQAVTSAIVDRINDGLLLIILLAYVLFVHGLEVVGTTVVITIIGSFGFLVLCVVAYVFFGQKSSGLVDLLAARFSTELAEKITRSYSNMLEVSRTFRRPRRLLAIFVVNGFVAMCDVGVMGMLVFTMGWDLPLMAALTITVFLWAGSALPSAPGFVGIFQIACVLALKLYGVDESSALAYSVVFHVLSLAAAVTQGSFAAASYGISLRKEYSRSFVDYNPTASGE
jgi:glycosyltransferase 2 family protein